MNAAIKVVNTLRHQVFVYGTLRHTEPNHHMMTRAGGQFAMQTTIQGEVFPTAFGYPCLMEGFGLVSGEVYSVDDRGLTVLDEFEDHPFLYERKATKTAEGLSVWAYFGKEIQRAIVGEQ